MFERSNQGAVDVIRGDDPFNLEQVQKVSQLFEECLRYGQPRIVFDLERVPLIDSAALELLLDIQDRCLMRGGTLKLAGPNPLCREILEITDAASRFDIFSDTVSAAGSFTR